MCSILLAMGGSVQAAVMQANPQTQYKTVKTAPEWMNLVRTMEDTNGAMGLTEKRNSNLTSTTATINNIDVHCVKSTEYGAMAILSASGYGNSSNNNAITTTTGNNTGIILNTSYGEWVMGIGNTDEFPVERRYYDYYNPITDPEKAKIGDALGSSEVTNVGCAGWHRASLADWSDRWSLYGFYRGKGGIFSFSMASLTGRNDNGGTMMNAHNQNGYPDEFYTRAVVVCGQGL